MKQQFLLLFFLLSFVTQAQTSPPTLPPSDYAVYTGVLNGFSGCMDMNQAHLRGGLLFVKEKTETTGPYGFPVQFRDLTKRLKQDPDTRNTPVVSDSAWVSFLQSVDSTQFVSYAVDAKQIGPLACRKSVQWTAELQEKYFGPKGQGPGYFAIRRDYLSFVSLINFSKVAYSTDQNRAFCCFSEASDGENGAGYVVFLERRGSYWQVVATMMLWIS